ncbi:hypothetical protein ES708_22907 [subsurface metagenome]
MEQAIQLFGYLILAVLGFVFPVVTVLLSLNREGLSKLAAQYEAEKSHSEENIREQFQKKEEKSGLDLLAIEKSLKKLKSIRKAAETKLSYLNPRNTTIRLFIPLIVAFLGVVATFLILHFADYFIDYAYLYPLLVSLVAFGYAVFVLWKLVGIIVEVRKIIDTDRKDTDTRTTELLSKLVQETDQHYLKRVYIHLDGKNIDSDSGETKMKVNIKKELEVGVNNYESRMVKNVEIGFIFPTNFIIEKIAGYSIYRDEKQQICRYNEDYIHGHTLQQFASLIITPLEQGDFEFKTFVKAENIESIYRNHTIKVT